MARSMFLFCCFSLAFPSPSTTSSTTSYSFFLDLRVWVQLRLTLLARLRCKWCHFGDTSDLASCPSRAHFGGARCDFGPPATSLRQVACPLWWCTVRLRSTCDSASCQSCAHLGGARCDFGPPATLLRQVACPLRWCKVWLWPTCLTRPRFAVWCCACFGKHSGEGLRCGSPASSWSAPQIGHFGGRNARQIFW